MADSDKLNLANRIIKAQKELIQSFDDWVVLVKANDLDAASELVKKANKMRLQIAELDKEYVKLNKKSGIILLNKN
jgi:hypothetical protein